VGRGGRVSRQARSGNNGGAVPKFRQRARVHALFLRIFFPRVRTSRSSALELLLLFGPWLVACTGPECASEIEFQKGGTFLPFRLMVGARRVLAALLRIFLPRVCAGRASMLDRLPLLGASAARVHWAWEGRLCVFKRKCRICTNFVNLFFFFFAGLSVPLVILEKKPPELSLLSSSIVRCALGREGLSP
jgi:hypothetical protein